MHRLILLRHGESTWNLENRFTGWTDVDLTPLGRGQAAESGRKLRLAGLEPDLAFTSVLKRAIHTLWIALDEMDRAWIETQRDWRLNERHYGALTGLNKAETAARHGEEQVRRWRRSFDERPPALDPADPRVSYADPRYSALSRDQIPLTESLSDAVRRTLPSWNERIGPAIRSGRRVLIAAHHNSLRGLVKHLDGMSDEAIAGFEIPTGAGLIYELDDELRPMRRDFL